MLLAPQKHLPLSPFLICLLPLRVLCFLLPSLITSVEVVLTERMDLGEDQELRELLPDHRPYFRHSCATVLLCKTFCSFAQGNLQHRNMTEAFLAPRPSQAFASLSHFFRCFLACYRFLKLSHILSSSPKELGLGMILGQVAHQAHFLLHWYSS